MKSGFIYLWRDAKRNNPNRKNIMTPFGEFMSAEEFANQTKLITANGLRNWLNSPNKIITKINALFGKENIGMTPTEAGYYYVV